MWSFLWGHHPWESKIWALVGSHLHCQHRSEMENIIFSLWNQLLLPLLTPRLCSLVDLCRNEMNSQWIQCEGGRLTIRRERVTDPSVLWWLNSMNNWLWQITLMGWLHSSRSHSPYPNWCVMHLCRYRETWHTNYAQESGMTYGCACSLWKSSPRCFWTHSMESNMLLLLDHGRHHLPHGCSHGDSVNWCCSRHCWLMHKRVFHQS